MSKILANQIANYGDDAPIEIKEGLNIPAGKPIQAAGNAGSSGQVLSTTGVDLAWITPFDGDYNSLSNKPTIPAAQINADWNASSGLGVILNKPAVPPLPSVTVGAVGSSSLSYNSGNGEFTFTPPDLSNYDTAYGWGNHASAGYLTSLGDAAGVTTAKISNWDDAHSWGNHAIAGYLTSYSEADTLDTVLSRGATTTRDITTTGKLYYSNNFATTGDLPNATTYHGMFAHVHAEGHGYFAHAGAWTQLLDTTSSIDELGDVDLAIAPTDGYVLKWEASSSSWKAFPDLVGTSNAGITLQDLSVQTASAGSTSLSYSNTTGVFTYTPPDLSGYLTTETDPVFSASPAGGILSSNITNWDAAYGWGNHASAGYLVATAQDKTNWNTAYGWGNHASGGYLTTYTETDPVFGASAAAGITNTKITEWDTAYGWGNYAPNGALNLSGSAASLKINNTSGTGYAMFDYAAASNAAYQLPALPSTSGDVLSCTTGGVMSWVTPSGGGGGANVTISDTIPAGSPSSGDLWWESDTGRLKVYYTDTDSSQWVDASPPLADATTIGGSGTVSMLAHLIPNSNAAHDIGSADYKIRHLFLSDNTLYHEGPYIKTAQHDAGGSAQTASYVITLAKLKQALNASTDFDDFKAAILAITDA